MSKVIYSLQSLNTLLTKEKPSKVCLVTSYVLVGKLYKEIKSIRSVKIEVILIPDGEKAKEWRELEKLLKKFSEINLDRNAIILALGGGSVGDLVGFAASIYLRGIRYVQIPTTLLAQVDSAHGGKTGINFLGFKNQLGNFRLPIATVVDVSLLKSLSKDQVIDGLGEIIKASLIKDPKIISILKKETLATFLKSPRLLELVKKSITVKLSYTEQDHKDMKDRQLLNAGHTIGHAIELKYRISHGKAVIIGLLQELMLTEALGLSDLSVRAHLNDVLHALGISIDEKMKAEWSAILHDKKIDGKSILFPVIEKIGVSKLAKIDLKVLRRFVEKEV